MRQRLMRWALGLTAVLGTGAAGAQAPERLAPPLPDTTAALAASSRAAALVLTENGLGAAYALRVGLSADLSLAAELSVGAVRDEREQQFFVGLFGDSVTPLKRNYVALIPLHAGLDMRLGRQRLEDTVRPFVQILAGPSLAVQWPYFDDRSGDGIRQADEERLGAFGGLRDARVRWGVGGQLALGAAFGRPGRAGQSLRAGVAAHVVPAGLDLLEPLPGVEQPSRTFVWTPTVTLLVTRPGAR